MEREEARTEGWKGFGWQGGVFFFFFSKVGVFLKCFRSFFFECFFFVFFILFHVFFCNVFESFFGMFFGLVFVEWLFFLFWNALAKHFL